MIKQIHVFGASVRDRNGRPLSKLKASIAGGLVAALAMSISATPARAFTGYLYASTASTIERFTPAGVRSTFVTGLNVPTGLAFDTNGNLYAAIAGDGTIQKFTPNGVGSTLATGLNSPFGLAIDANGNLYAADGDNTIQKVTPGGVVSTFASTGVNDPYGLTFDASGNLYVANNGDSSIVKFTPDGVGTTFRKSHVNGLFGLAIDPTGRGVYTSSRDPLMYVVAGNDGATPNIVVTPMVPVDVGGTLADFAGDYTIGAGVNFGGLAIGSPGEIYAVMGINGGLGNASGFIEKITPLGYSFGSNQPISSLGSTFATGLDSPSFIAFGPAALVPEPATSALTLFGAGGVFLALRFRRRSISA